MARTHDLIGDTRSRVLDLLREAPRTVADVADTLGITGNAVRGHVTALQRDGLVRESGRAPSSGGKPARLYEITPSAEELYPKAYALVLGELIRVLRERDGPDSVVELLRTVGARAAGNVERGGRSAGSAVALAADVLRSVGGEVTVVPVEGGWEIRGVGCPLSSVVVGEPDACAVAEGLVAEATGLAVTECCDRSGERPRCVLRVAADVTPPPRSSPAAS